MSVRLIIQSDSIQLKIINAESLAFIQEKYLFTKKENVLRWMRTSNQVSNTTKFWTCLQYNMITVPEVFKVVNMIGLSPRGHLLSDTTVQCAIKY